MGAVAWQAAGVDADNARPPRRKAEPGTSLNDHRSRTEAAKAQTAELDLADRLRMTLRRDDVERAAADAGETLKQVAAQIVRDRAERLSRIEDVREMERALDELVTELLSAGARAFRQIARKAEGDRNTDAA